MPIGQLPDAVQTGMIIFPPFHSAMLFRQILMEKSFEAASAAGASELDIAEVSELLGVTFSFGNFEITPVISVLYLIAAGLLFFGLSAMKTRKLGK